MQYWQKKLQRLTQWWKTPAGNVLLQLEKEYLANYLQTLFGSQLVLIADESFLELSNISRMSHCVRIDPFSENISRLPTNIDVLVVPHILSFMLEPNDWLKGLFCHMEANSKLIFTGFNYCSLLGLQSLLLSHRLEGLPGQNNSLVSIKHLLAKNDFQIQELTKFAPLWLRTKMELLDTPLHQSFLGDIYCLVANKELVTVKTFKAKWSSDNSLRQPEFSPPLHRGKL